VERFLEGRVFLVRFNFMSASVVAASVILAGVIALGAPCVAVAQKTRKCVDESGYEGTFRRQSERLRMRSSLTLPVRVHIEAADQAFQRGKAFKDAGHCERMRATYLIALAAMELAERTRQIAVTEKELSRARPWLSQVNQEARASRLYVAGLLKQKAEKSRLLQKTNTEKVLSNEPVKTSQ